MEAVTSVIMTSAHTHTYTHAHSSPCQSSARSRVHGPASARVHAVQRPWGPLRSACTRSVPGHPCVVRCDGGLGWPHGARQGR
eukprot:1143847-Pelagomonas_calceolata.AAC.4